MADSAPGAPGPRPIQYFLDELTLIERMAPISVSCGSWKESTALAAAPRRDLTRRPMRPCAPQLPARPV